MHLGGFSFRGLFRLPFLGFVFIRLSQFLFVGALGLYFQEPGNAYF